MPELNTLGTVIKQTYEDEADTNAFTDAEKSKLAGIEAGAQVNVAAPVQSVNGETGAVQLSAADVGALPTSYAPAIADVAGLQGILDDLEQRLAAIEGGA